MKFPEWVRPWSFVLALLGAAVVVAGLQIWVWGGVAKFHYQVDSEPVSEQVVNETLAEMGDSADRADLVYEFSTLSPQSQTILRDAIAADGQWVSRYGQGNGAPEIEIPGHVYGPGESDFYLAYQEAYYRLETAGETGRVGMGDVIVSISLAISGALLWLVGVILARSERLTAGTLVGVGSVALLSILELHKIGLTGQTTMVASGLIVFGATTVAAWYVAGFDPAVD